ncbi:capsule synthesis protein PGA_cap [Mucilaginibacter gracilis]|uniref:Capsule synthesis protein PGA_cap n=1 Tax=Mucilaginibacter gracilis TaxID=423350 RepID=A0A495IX88_9SPHI|nr:CapA family protein [Mucilaginibacter gracilis]RKR81306.1 capsule synthesis protein PGA_cap [Mucilaginibacter gracilis]
MKRRKIHITLLAPLLLFACTNEPHTAAVHTKPIVVVKPVAPQPTIDTTIAIAAVGDMMLGTAYPTAYTLPPDSGKSSFKAAEKYIKDADVAFGNLEGALADSGTPIGKKKLKPYSFRMPVKYCSIFKAAGFDVLSVANNHIDDFGDSGRQSTTNTLDSNGIYYAGLQTHPSTIFTIKGVKYGFCAFSPNSQVVSLHDFKNAAAIIQGLKQQVDIVIVSFHGGGEGAAFEHVPFKKESYIGENRGDVHAFAHNAIDAGADVIFGNGPHVSRAMELYKNRLIAYSLGNFCTYKSVSVSGVCGLAPLLKVKLNKKGEFLNGQIIAFKQTHANGLERDSLNRAVTRIKYLTETDFPQSGLSISADGVINRVD